MRNVYKSLMVIGTSFLLGAGTMWADGRYWTYDASAGATAPDNVQAGQPYFLQTGRSEAAGAAWFLWGDRFKSTSSLTSDFVYYFEEVPGETAKNGAKVYYIKRQNGDYLAQPGNAQLYTPSVERAWKVTVHTAENRDPEYTYSHANPDGAAPTQYKGMDAFINEAKDNNDFSNLNLAAASYLNLSNGLTITSVEANKADDPTSPFTALLNYPGDNTASNVALGTDYSRNVWLAYPASKQSAIDALKGVMQEVTGGQTLEEKIKSYQVGSGVAQYSKEKHDKLVELWNKAKAYADGTATGTDTEIEAVAEALLPAYQDFVASPNPLVPGYYIVTSWRAENGSDYDGGALYDRSAVDPGDRTLRWTLRKNDGVDYNESDPLSYNTCKMVWEVVAAKKEGQFYFRNFETGNYIGTAAALYNAISVTEAPVNTYNIQANPKIPGYFCFYSPDLPKSSAGTGRPTVLLGTCAPSANLKSLSCANSWSNPAATPSSSASSTRRSRVSIRVIATWPWTMPATRSKPLPPARWKLWMVSYRAPTSSLARWPTPKKVRVPNTNSLCCSTTKPTPISTLRGTGVTTLG